MRWYCARDFTLLPVESDLRLGRPFVATRAVAEPPRSEHPTTFVQGDRVTHLVYDVSR